MDKIYKLDNIDIGILEILMKNAKIPYTEIAKKLIVSTGTIHVRMKKMENYGIVKKIKLEKICNAKMINIIGDEINNYRNKKSTQEERVCTLQICCMDGRENAAAKRRSKAALANCAGGCTRIMRGWLRARRNVLRSRGLGVGQALSVGV